MIIELHLSCFVDETYSFSFVCVQIKSVWPAKSIFTGAGHLGVLNLVQPDHQQSQTSSNDLFSTYVGLFLLHIFAWPNQLQY